MPAYWNGKPIEQVPPDELRDAAKAIWPLAGGHEEHWCLTALLIGRVEDENLYEEWGFESGREWAAEELGLTPTIYIELAGLATLVKKAESEGAMALLQQVPKSSAKLVKKVDSVGADLKVWLAKAGQQSYRALKADVVKAMGHEVWTRVTVDVPTDHVALVEEALVKALAVVFPDETVDPQRARDRDVRFRCLEVVCAAYLQDEIAASLQSSGTQPAPDSGV